MTHAFGMLIPPEMMPLLLVVAGILMIVGMRRLGGLLILFVLVKAFFLPFGKSLINMMPPWLLVIAVMLFAMRLLVGLASLLIGKGAAEQMLGNLAADFFKALFLFPLLLGRLLMRLMRRA